VKPGEQREGDLLLAATAQITSGFCPWCPTRRVLLRWSDTGNRWQLVVVHRPRCSATRTPFHRYRADEYLVSLLTLYDAPIGHYGEDNLVVHRKVQVL
jgi:hypothetical protein